LVVTPFVAMPVFLNRHVDYKGYATENYPLQDIYFASDYSLEEKQMYLATQDGLKDALIAMSAYSSFEDVVIDVMEQNHIPRFIGAIEKPFVKLSLKMLFGSNKVNELKPVKQIKNAGERPVLLVACTGDASVPAVSTERLKKANPKAQTWIRDS